MRRSIDEELETKIETIIQDGLILANDNGQAYIQYDDTAVQNIKNLISQEVLKGQIQEVKDMYSWAGDNFVPRSRLRLRLSELKDLLKKEEL